MSNAAAIQDALEHYRIKWYDAFTGVVTWASIAAAWQTEYDAVASGAFEPTLVTSASFDGGSGSGQKEFEQTARLAGLKIFRAELDSDFAAVLAPPAVEPAPRRMGLTVKLCP